MLIVSWSIYSWNNLPSASSALTFLYCFYTVFWTNNNDDDDGGDDLRHPFPCCSSRQRYKMQSDSYSSLALQSAYWVVSIGDFIGDRWMSCTSPGRLSCRRHCRVVTTHSRLTTVDRRRSAVRHTRSLAVALAGDMNEWTSWTCWPASPVRTLCFETWWYLSLILGLRRLGT